MLTYITSQDILKLGNWIPYRTRSRTGWQAKIRVLEEKGTQRLSVTSPPNTGPPSMRPSTVQHSPELWERDNHRQERKSPDLSLPTLAGL